LIIKSAQGERRQIQSAGMNFGDRHRPSPWKEQTRFQLYYNWMARAILSRIRKRFEKRPEPRVSAASGAVQELSQPEEKRTFAISERPAQGVSVSVQLFASPSLCAATRFDFFCTLLKHRPSWSSTRAR